MQRWKDGLFAQKLGAIIGAIIGILLGLFISKKTDEVIFEEYEVLEEEDETEN